MIKITNAEKYCKDDISKIENYELAKADNFKGWVIHHRDEYKVLPSGIEVFRTKAELIENGRYFNCPANELIFMTSSEHQAYHMKHITKERRVKLSEGNRRRQYTEETRKKMSESAKKRWSNKCELPLITDYKYINIKLIERYTKWKIKILKHSLKQ